MYIIAPVHDEDDLAPAATAKGVAAPAPVPRIIEWSLGPLHVLCPLSLRFLLLLIRCTQAELSTQWGGDFHTSVTVYLQVPILGRETLAHAQGGLHEGLTVGLDWTLFVGGSFTLNIVDGYIKVTFEVHAFGKKYSGSVQLIKI
jgi:hypothetical protein